MIKLARHDDGFRVTDPAKNTVRVKADDWDADAEAAPISDALARHEMGPDDPETTLTARTTRLEFPPVYAVTTPVGEMDHTDIGGSTGERHFPADDYLLRIEASVRVFLRVEGAMTIRRESSEGLWIEFQEPTPVSLAFGSHVDLPGSEVVVPETPEGVATALSVLHSANETTSPDRTWPTLRNRPPNVRFGDETTIPESVRDDRDDTGIEAVFPPDLTELLPAASLIHYLGADVTVEPDIEPLLDLDGREIRLGTGSDLTETASDILRRCFYLDCVARGAGPHGGPLAVAHTFETLELDAERLYDAPLAERVKTYVNADFDAVADEFPEWHFSMYVEPTYEHATVIPHLVETLPFFFHPSAEPLSKKEWLALSLTGGGYDSVQLRKPEETPTPGAGGREVSNVDLVKPDLGPGRTHGWLAEGVPVDGFKTLPEAYRHRDRYLDDTEEELSVTAVVNDTDYRQRILDTTDGPGMEDERDATVEHYERRAEDLNIDVTVRENVSTSELARIFESRNDLVHFVGHHSEDGLQCRNGYLSAESVARSRTETFFLNACGSYPFGQALVRKGSVVGGVTFESVGDEDAFKVGSTFAGLLTLGYSINRALSVANQQAIAPKDYTIVGDATHRVMQSDTLVPPEGVVFSRRDGDYEIVRKHNSTGFAGAEIHLDGTLYLFGNPMLFELSENELPDRLDKYDSPVIFEGSLYWPKELKRELLN